MNKLILIDGNSLFFRAYYATAYRGGELMKNKEGVYTNALFAFVNMIEKILEEPHSHILVAFDTDKPTKRHLAYEDYKKGREKMPEEMAVQVPLIHEYLKHMGISDYALAGYEADDIIGTLAEKGSADLLVEIYSSDKDLLQLINDHVTVKLIKKGMSDLEVMTPKTFYETYLIDHKYMVDLKALMGDSSDNIPGIPGVGLKTATKLIQTYGNLDNIFAHQEKIKGKLGELIKTEEAKARLSYDLAQIDTNVPLEIKLDQIKRKKVNTKELIEFYQKMDLHSFIKKMQTDDYDLFSMFDEKEELLYEVLTEKSDIKKILKPNLAIHLEFFETNYHNSKLLGFGISDGLKHYYIDADVALSSKDFTDYLASDIPKITFDYKAFKVAMKWQGFDLNGVFYDMLLASYLYYSQIAKSDFKIICLTFDYHDVEYDDTIYGKGRKRKVPNDDILRAHIISKAKAIYVLKDVILDYLKKREQIKLNDLEIKVANVLALMEYQGILVDLDELASQKEKLYQRITELEEKIYELAGMQFNIKSPKQLGEVLFEHLELETFKKTRTKNYSTNAEVLNFLKDKHPVIKYIIDYRQLTKLYSTYIEGIENTLFADNKIHTIYAQALTLTGRLSSIEPNLQNIPVRTLEGKEIRKLFIARDGYTLLSADYSQIELRVLAHMSQAKALLQDFNNDQDIHVQTAMKVFGTKEVSPYERFRAKAVNFGIIYGIGAWSLAEDIQTTVPEAQAFIDKYFTVYPEIKTFMDKTVLFAKENGFVTTIMNRRRYIPELKNSVFSVKEFGKRTAMNAPIQGSAADIIKKAMVDLADYISKNQMQSKILLQVHDELILEVPNNELERMKKVVPEIMANAFSLDVKLKTNCQTGSSWYHLD